MLSSVVRFVRMPLLLVTIWAVVRFILGVAGVPYVPRGNAMFSLYSVMMLSCLYFGALSKNLADFKWGGTVLTGVTIGVYSQILILLATVISYAGDLNNSYFVHWDALNVDPTKLTPPVAMADALVHPEQVPMPPISQALVGRLLGIVINGVIAGIFAVIGRLLSGLAPKSAA
ncbi:MAG: hypothetical protein ONB46_12595 [candidate division KSB1 bacterium]|nr:hypothetical protein [candidate division KSB1 bacterium]MDZ7366557.1 hypothetical protein [candidate division KSB1 bacterium]MDZ7405960.1 hypothetical protein [candidate division KSB1 bacterium]